MKKAEGRNSSWWRPRKLHEQTISQRPHIMAAQLPGVMRGGDMRIVSDNLPQEMML